MLSLKSTLSLRYWHIILAALLLVGFSAQAALGSPLNSAAFDEEYHLGTGYAYLRTGNPRLSTEHPPLVNVWNALPLVFLNPQLPLDSLAWQTAHTDDFCDAFLWQANPELAVRMILLGRLPIIALGVLLGAVVFRWTRDLFGIKAALLALTLYTFDPNLIAHSRLSSTDLGLALAMTVAMWRLWAWLEKPAGWNLVWVGVAAGAAMTTKFTGLLLAPIGVMVVLLHPVGSQARAQTILRRLIALGLAGLGALIVTWAVYGFEIRNGLPAATYWRGLGKIYAEYSQGYPTFLFGQVSRTGWWYYFPVTFALKTPLPVLILFIAGLGLSFRQGAWRCASAVLIPPTLSMIAAMFSPLAIGYRHILPILPFVIAIAGNTANTSPKSFHHLVTLSPCHLVLALLAWHVSSAAFIYPHHLSYFNELAGGPGNAHNILVDSNLDWGQDLVALKTWMDKNRIERVNLAYFGTTFPEAYGVRYWPLPGFLRFIIGPEVDSFNPYTPEPGWYAVSATSLRLGLLYRAPDLLAYFRAKTPVARAGYSILLYKVEYPPETPIDRAVIIGASTFAVSPQTLGVRPGHRLIAKWADNPNVFIFAMNGPARYIAPDPLPFDRDLRRAFRSAAQREGDAWIVDARPLVESRLAEWQANRPLWWLDHRPLDWPVNFEDRLALIGYRAESSTVAPGDALDLTTYWRVVGELVPPVAFFAHFTDDQPHIVGQYDGWGTAIRGLEIGDVIVQHVQVPVGSNVSPGPYHLELGVYSPDSMRRWTIVSPAQHGAAADRVRLAPVQIVTR